MFEELMSDPDSMTTVEPASVRYDDEMVFVEQRGEPVIVASYTPTSGEDMALRPRDRWGTDPTR
jgi:hypothetical protein